MYAARFISFLRELRFCTVVLQKKLAQDHKHLLGFLELVPALLLTKLRLLTLLLETPPTSCALGSDTATEGSKLA